MNHKHTSYPTAFWKPPAAKPPSGRQIALASFTPGPEALVTNTRQVFRDHQFLQFLHNLRLRLCHICSLQGIHLQVEQQHAVLQAGLHTILIPAMWHHTLPPTPTDSVPWAMPLDLRWFGPNITATIAHPSKVEIARVTFATQIQFVGHVRP